MIEAVRIISLILHAWVSFTICRGTSFSLNTGQKKRWVIQTVRSSCSNSQSCHWCFGGHIPYGLCHGDLRVSNTIVLRKMSKTTYPIVMEKQEWASTAFQLGRVVVKGHMMRLFVLFSQSHFSFIKSTDIYCIHMN